MMGWYDWRPRVSAAERRKRAAKEMEKLRKKGLDVRPVKIAGRRIATTFWGEAWCAHLESFSDYDNRLPRGRTYVRNGSVCHLDVARGAVSAMVSGSEIYKVKISIRTLPAAKWADVANRCAGHVGSLLELLQGRLSANVMAVVTDRKSGLFPLPGEIKMTCSCPDWAVMCKHVAAVLYGVGARLDEQPELLFLLRGVNHEDLISAEAGAAAAVTDAAGGRRRIADDALADVFGIEVSQQAPPSHARKPQPAPVHKAKRGKQAANAAPHVGKPPASGKAGAGRAPRYKPEPQPLTGKAVADLRAMFEMSKPQFGRLLGVSAPCIASWEENAGPLNPRAPAIEAWKAVSGLSKRQAWRKLKPPR
jgi:uncharacterized Zn finger protein